jgi:phosphate-selective porin OprO/OprP
MAQDRKRSTDIPRPDDLSATPGYPKVKITGFFQADAGWFAQDAASRATFGDIEDVRGFRRARLAAVGDVAENVSYMIEMDFAFLGRPSFMDVWADIHEVPVLGNVRVGQWRMPFGMDEITSVRELTFLERSLTFALAPFRQYGVGFHNHNEEETVTWAAAGFGYPTDPFGDAFGDRGYGAAARVTALPVYVDDGCQLLHVGADWAYFNPSNGVITFRNQPEFAGPFAGPLGNLASVPFFVDTGALPAEDANLLNAEVGYGLGSWYVQSELRYALVNLAGAGTAALPGLYVQTGYFLTGERRPYDRQNGVFGRVRPLAPVGKCGLGALEVAARYSYLNLNDDGVRGGELNDVTLGLNWYLNQYTKFQFNYIRAMLRRNGLDSDTDIVALRCQLDF